MVKADQLRRQVDFIRRNRLKLKCFKGFFTKCFQRHAIWRPPAKDFPRHRINVVHNQVHIPLREEFKTGPFGKDHAQQGVRLLKASFLPALHRVAKINTGALYASYAGFKGIGITKFRTTVRQDVFEYGYEFICSQAFFQTVEHTPDRVFRASLHKEGQEQLFPGEKHGQQGLF